MSIGSILVLITRKKRLLMEFEKLYIAMNCRLNARPYTKAAKKRVKRIDGGYNGTRLEFREKVLGFWKKYGKKPRKFWYDLYCNGLDSYDPRFIPDEMWHRDFLPYFNYHINRKAYRDKAMYHKLITGVKLPETIVKNIAGYYYDGDGENEITQEEAERLCLMEGKLIFKPSVYGGGGKDVTFYDRKESKSIAELFETFEANFVVQRLVKQHPDLARINKESLNTVRVMSFRFKGKVHILSAQLRMGGVGSRVDNVTAGGCACVIKPDGWLEEKAVTRMSQWTDEHASGLKFKDIRVPSFDRIIETAKQLHTELPYFNIIGWDFAVDEEGDPVMIEFNLAPEQNQIGGRAPAFGDLSEEVFEEVFLKKSLKDIFY